MSQCVRRNPFSYARGFGIVLDDSLNGPWGQRFKILRRSFHGPVMTQKHPGLLIIPIF